MQKLEKRKPNRVEQRGRRKRAGAKKVQELDELRAASEEWR